MITGSSSIQFEPQKQLITPDIKVNMNGNLMRGTTIYNLISGFSHSGWPLGSAINFNNRNIYTIYDQGFNQVLVFSSGESDPLPSTGTGVTCKMIFDILGNSMVFLRNQFYQNGDTLELIYTWYNNIGATRLGKISMITSIDGMAWGGSQLLYEEPRNLYWSPDKTSPQDIIKTSANIIYFNETEDNSTTMYIYSLLCNAGTWGETHLIVSDDYYTVRMGGIRHENIDTIIYSAGDRNVLNQQRIIQIQSDGVNLLNKQYLNNSNNNEVIIVNKIVKGISYYHAFFEVGFNKYVYKYQYTWYGRTAVVAMDKMGYYTKSVDAWNWNNLMLLNIGITDNESNPFPRSAILVNNTDDNDLRFLYYGLSVIAKRCFYIKSYAGTSTIDLSDNIINYQNQNNERVTLTLGNYK